jgi:hypothetical protein
MKTDIYEKMSTVTRKCKEIEKEAQNESEIVFLETASAFFNEISLHDELYPEARTSFMKEAIHQLESIL